MNRFSVEVLRGLRAAHKTLWRRDDPTGFSFANVQVSGQAASDLIRARLASGAPAMVARFGSAELRAALCHEFGRREESGWHKALQFIRREYSEYWWDRRVVRGMTRNAGFFPADTRLLARFAELLVDDMRQVDVLGSWMTAERVFAEQLRQARFVNLEDLPPWVHTNPWSEALAGRTVLVIHPFVKSIEAQYRKRALLFDDPRVLPEFELKTLRAVQSIAYNDTGFADWFAALHSMEEQIERTPFDVAIIGCGAYGFSLAAFVKRLGRQAVHLGGATQLLFGIKGKRWGEMGNAHWVRPLEDERPPGFHQVEGGCYW
jgi:hypothetical protein